MKSTEMIFLDNESLWEAIEKYAATQSLLDSTHDRLEHDSELEEPQKDYDDAKNALRLMLGLPNESESKPSVWDLYGEKKNGRSRLDISIPKIPKPTLEESGGRQDGELWTNWVRTYWRDGLNELKEIGDKFVYPSKEMATREALASAMRLGSIRQKISHDYDIDENLNVVLVEWHTKERTL